MKLASIALFAVALLTVGHLSGNENPAQDEYNSEYCNRVAMYEHDVLMGNSQVRGHRNFNNIECGE